jgi:hypothetical protein
MNPIKKMICRWVREDWNSESDRAEPVRAQEVSLSEYNYDNRINFSIYNASGGKVIEASRYDTLKDRRRNNLYVIHENEDFTESLGKIITMESLR